MSGFFHINDKGIIIPNPELGLKATNPNPDYDPTGPKFNPANQLRRLGIPFSSAAIPPFHDLEQAVHLCERARSEIEAHKFMAGILRGPCLPLVTPQILEQEDYGEGFLQFLYMVKRAYEVDFPENRLQVVPPRERIRGYLHPMGRHKDWWHSARQAPSFNLYFPFAMLGIAPSSARILEQHLPPGFSLAGPITNAAALVGYDEYLLGQQRTKVVDGAGAYWNSPEESLFFQPHRWWTVLYVGLDSQDENFSPGLVYTVKA